MLVDVVFVVIHRVLELESSIAADTGIAARHDAERTLLPAMTRQLVPAYPRHSATTGTLHDSHLTWLTVDGIDEVGDSLLPTKLAFLLSKFAVHLQMLFHVASWDVHTAIIRTLNW